MKIQKDLEIKRMIRRRCCRLFLWILRKLKDNTVGYFSIVYAMPKNLIENNRNLVYYLEKKRKKGESLF